ncbi:hypothetical protein BDN70DRAFT_880436 [Pholiota conissans]|uniref:Uncharacterized protein n=1 Tax=Pholiota conissans TaxID=109636 RepID=A0A9P5Z255_9AGAR|nr:hypothetical protein BDN70DRAFT_880436 [Pholiota conissans]
MADTVPSPVPVQHAPAMKVGGRRLSVSTKHKPAAPQEEPSPAQNEPNAPIPDYPRPAPPDDNVPPPHQHQHHEEQPKKEKKIYLPDVAARKAEMLRPTRDNIINKDHAAGIRISQPSKALGV